MLGIAAVAAAESSILSDRNLNNGKYSTSLDQRYTKSGIGSDGKPVIDLSEKQISYFVNTYIDDPDSPQNGEGGHYRKGTYKVRIRVRAAGDKAYRPKSKTVTVKIRVS